MQVPWREIALFKTVNFQLFLFKNISVIFTAMRPLDLHETTFWLSEDANVYHILWFELCLEPGFKVVSN